MKIFTTKIIGNYKALVLIEDEGGIGNYYTISWAFPGGAIVVEMIMKK